MQLFGNLLQDSLSGTAQRLPEKTALVCGQERWSYRRLDQASDGIANGLRQGGVGRGDRVLIVAENGAAAVIAFWAVLKADAVVTLVSPHTRPEKLAYYLKDTRATGLIIEAALVPALLAVIEQAAYLQTVMVAGESPSATLPGLQTFDQAEHRLTDSFAPPRNALDIDLASIIYTSGSTGEPKGVMLTHRNMLAARASINHYLGNTEDDVILAALPLCFDYGLYQMIMAISVGAVLLMERSFCLLPQVLARASREGVTAFPAVPAVFAMLAEMPANILPSVRYVSNTSAALADKHIRAIGQWFPHASIYSMYGLTECKRCTYLPPDDLTRKPGSVGIAIPGTELWLVDDQDRRLGPDQVGQLVIRGATVMRGYWEKPEASLQRLRPGPLPGELVLYTGDLCRLDDDGYLYFVARMDDLIKSKGEMIAPREVELALLNIVGVKEVAVVGVPDEVWGHAIAAFIVPEGSAVLDADQIRAACRTWLEPAQIPKYLHLVEQLPRTANGKIDKSALHGI